MDLLLLLLWADMANGQQLDRGGMGWEVHAATVSLMSTFVLEAANEVASRMIAWFRRMHVMSSSSANEHEWLSKHIPFIAATRK